MNNGKVSYDAGGQSGHGSANGRSVFEEDSVAQNAAHHNAELRWKLMRVFAIIARAGREHVQQQTTVLTRERSGQDILSQTGLEQSGPPENES